MVIDLALVTEDVLHHTDEAQGTCIAHTVKNAIRIFAGRQDALITQNGQVLGDVALRGANAIDNLLNANFAIAKGTEYL